MCVKFKNILKRNYQPYLKSPMSRGMKKWDTLTIEVQHRTIKVKFKKALKVYVGDHCSATWCIFIFKSKCKYIYQNERIY